MPATYESIASTTLGSNQSTVTFSSISGSYTDLVLVIQAACVEILDDIWIQFNSDTGTNYSYTILSGDGSTAQSARNSNAARGLLDYYGTPNTTVGESQQIVHIMNYSNITTNKTYISRTSRASGGTDAIVGLWRNTSAITSLQVFFPARTVKSGSTFYLFGIKAA